MTQAAVEGAQRVFAGSSSRRAFTPSSSSSDEDGVARRLSKQAALSRTRPHWSARLSSPAPPGGVKPDTVRRGCSVGAGLRLAPRSHNGAEPLAPVPRLQFPAAPGTVPSAN